MYNTIFCLFSFKQSQENSPQSLMLSEKGEDSSTSQSDGEYSENSSDTAYMNLCDEKDIRFIRTHS